MNAEIKILPLRRRADEEYNERVESTHNILSKRLEGETGVGHRVGDLLDRVDVRGGSQVESEVELLRGAHDCLSGALHGVVKTGVHDVLFGRTSDTLLEGVGRGDWNLAAFLTKTAFK